MPSSQLQEPFLRELAESFKATATRIVRRLKESRSSETDAVINDELRGLYHGMLVVFDGGSALADQGLLTIVDEYGDSFDRNLHETCLRYWSMDVE